MNVSQLFPLRARRRGMTTAQKAVLGGAITLVAAPVIHMLAANLRKRRLNGEQARAESETSHTCSLSSIRICAEPST